MGSKPVWDRDHAAVGGNMVRLFKVLSAHLDQTVQRRYENRQPTGSDAGRGERTSAANACNRGK